MFLVEMLAGALAGSQALQADALDFFADAMTYGISLVVIGSAVRVRAWAAFAKGASPRKAAAFLSRRYSNRTLQDDADASCRKPRRAGGHRAIAARKLPLPGNC